MVGVAGMLNPQILNDTGMDAVPLDRFTWTVPLQYCAGVSLGMKNSTQRHHSSPLGTVNGKAFRFSPTMSSTSGMSGSGARPVNPSGPVARDRLIHPTRYTRTF